jgi:hypothetical protein
MNSTALSKLSEENEDFDNAIPDFTVNKLINAIEVSADLIKRESKGKPIFSSPFVRSGFPGSDIQVNEAENSRFKQTVEYILTDMLAKGKDLGQLNPQKLQFLETSSRLAVDMIDKRVSPAIKRLLARPKWELSDLTALAIPKEKLPRNIRGIYALLCLETLYIGSSMNIHTRIFGKRGHQSHIDEALKKQLRSPASYVYDVVEQNGTQPLFLLLAIDDAWDQPAFLEVLEAVLITAFDTFQTTSRHHIQLTLTKSCRPMDLPLAP